LEEIPRSANRVVRVRDCRYRRLLGLHLAPSPLAVFAAAPPTASRTAKQTTHSSGTWLHRGVVAAAIAVVGHLIAQAAPNSAKNQNSE